MVGSARVPAVELPGQPREQTRVTATTEWLMSTRMIRRSLTVGKPVWFAAIRMGKNYVSYHLMPVYLNAGMQKRIPPELNKRMQGKACFNFSEIDPALFRQLAELTAAGFEGYHALK